jgi:hypothetical protein
VRGRVRPSATCLISETIPRILIKFGSEGEFNFDSCRSIITNSVKQSPSLEADSQSACKEIPGFCGSQKNPPLDSALSQVESVHALASYSCKMRSGIILQFISRSRKWSLFLKFSV